MAVKVIIERCVSIRFACICLGISETCFRYNPKLSNENSIIADWLLRLTQTHKRWGFGLCFMYLRNVKGFGWKHKRVYRIYRELELNLRIKPRRRIKRNRPDELSVPTSINQVIEWRGKPAALRCDNGPEYISSEMMSWANQHQITLLYIQPGKPTQNAYIERFNRTARHEWLDMHLFNSIEHAQLLATRWLWTYNNERPHSAIGGITPNMKLNVA